MAYGDFYPDGCADMQAQQLWLQSISLPLTVVTDTWCSFDITVCGEVRNEVTRFW